MVMMEAPWKETATVEEIDGGWYVAITPHGVKAYCGAMFYEGRLRLMFYEDIKKAHRYETREKAEAVAKVANDPKVDTMTFFAKPRRGSELIRRDRTWA